VAEVLPVKLDGTEKLLARSASAEDTRAHMEPAWNAQHD
jgi:hypothetical protein